jgi:hypothetical protein
MYACRLSWCLVYFHFLSFRCACVSHGAFLVLSHLCTCIHVSFILPLEFWSKNTPGDAGALVLESSEYREWSSVREEIDFLCTLVQVFQPKNGGHRRPYKLRRPSLGELRSNLRVPGTKHSLAGVELGLDASN